MAPERAGSRSGTLALLLIASVAIAGCQTLPKRLGLEALLREPELTFDRSSDLVPPEGLRIISTDERQVGLAWEPVLVGEIGGYAIMRAGRDGELFELAGRTRSRFETVYIDDGDDGHELGDGELHHYRVHPYDTDGRVSRSHAYISATTEPAPDAPSGLRVYSNLPRKVALSWEPNERRSVWGYTILRSPTVAGPWQRVGTVEGRLRTVFEDPVPGDLRVMYYRVVALNHFGAEGGMTEPARAATKAEPLPPLGVELAAHALGRVELSWQPNVERDLARYEIWRSAQDDGQWEAELLIGSVPAPDAEFSDTTVRCGQQLRYRLRAIDADGLLSTHSEPLKVTADDIGLRSKRRTDGRYELMWDTKTGEDWAGARILEHRFALPDRELGAVSAENRFALPPLRQGRHHLSVVLTRGVGADAPGEASAADWPPCEIELMVED